MFKKIFDPSKDDFDPVLSELNDKQRSAILCENKRLLVLAGAGAGKTKTIIQKIIYLISKKDVDPSQILAITFTKNAANEMIDRLILTTDEDDTYKKIIYNKKLQKKEKDYERIKFIRKYPWLSNITVKTFHSLSYYILKNYGSKEFDNKFTILTDFSNEDVISKNQANETQEQIIQKLILENCEDPEYLLKLKRYIIDNYVDAHRIKMHKLGNISYTCPYTTLKGDHVKSKSERDIADWLYRHYIDYKYEPIIAPGSFEFRPDFFIEEANLYLELVSNKSYPLKDKEKEMIEAGKTYIKIQEHETHDSNNFNKIMDSVVFSRIDKNLKKISPLIVSEEFRGYEKFLRHFILDNISVLDKIKVEDKNFEEIYQYALKDEYSRIRDFYEFLKTIFNSYRKYCIDHSYLDFNDLLIQNVSLFEKHDEIKKLFANKYKYILVDEFQDVNSLQVRLLKQLIKSETQLFCVGDDWQSIYGFRGSDVEYIINFKKFFEDSKIIKLDINYRSNDTIVNASNEVIKNNKYKIEKEIKSFNKTGKKIYLYCAKKEEEDGVGTVINNIKKILNNGYEREDILVLTRTRKSEAYDNYYRELKKVGIKITTIHQAKGLEAKVVFIIGLTAGYMGFPNVKELDRIFQMIKQSNIELLLEEERRLFYVALTRAKEELFLISEVGNESNFIKEIPGNFLDRSNFLILNVKNDKKCLCKFCGLNIEESYRYCPNCGKLVIENNFMNDLTIINEEKKQDSQKINNHEKSALSELSYEDRLKKIIEIHPNAYKPWENSEEENLIVLFKNGTSIEDIADKLLRQPSAIKSRLKKLGIIENK